VPSLRGADRVRVTVPRTLARFRKASAATGGLALALVVTSCSDGQPEWCDRLAEQDDLGALVSAVGEGDTAAAAEALDDLEELARSAPAPIGDEMDQIVEVLSEVVDLRLAEGDVAAGDLENQRARVNQRLEEVTVPTAEVGHWAETECGIVLD
jgi:hypothetical protein